MLLVSYLFTPEYDAKERIYVLWLKDRAAFRMMTSSLLLSIQRPVLTVRYYAIHITASQFLDKPRDASASVALGRNCKFAAISCYISETVQGINLAPKYLAQNANMKSYVIYRLVSLTLSDP